MRDENKKEIRELLLQIARCREIGTACSNETHCCHNIINTQRNNIRFQIPEPWNGNIETAEILFFASNPAIKEKECYPDKTWCEDSIVDFFEKRFEKEEYRNSNWFRRINKYAAWILNSEDSEEIKNKICISDIVHCKSEHQKGVNDSKDHCADLYLSEIINTYIQTRGDKTKYIVLLGKVAESYEESIRKIGIIPIRMPHPFAWKVTNKRRKEIIREWQEDNQKN